MSKRAILRLTGHLDRGFQVLLEIKSDAGTTLTEGSGELPALPQVQRIVENWRSDYRQCLERSRIGGVEIILKRSFRDLQQGCKKLGKQLENQLNQWLQSPGFQAVNLHLQRSLNPEETFQILIRTNDPQIHRLPWHSWEILEHYPLAEIILGSPSEAIAKPTSQSQKVRILAILGDSTGIDTEVDRQVLEALPQAQVRFLVEPSRREISDRLWDQPWDILFFAGHSHSDGRQGKLGINPQESLSVEELKFGLRKAIDRGLQLAIFNSCDGLGIAYELEQLHIPQVVVMREPVPDPVAQSFLKHFLADFSNGSALHLSLRRARERLQASENLFPNATWLPVLFQNPALETTTWNGLKRPLSWRERLGRSAGVGLGMTLAVMGVRSLGLLQSAELAVYDHWLQIKPAEAKDDRIVIVEVTDTDVQAQPAEERLDRSLSDRTLDKLLEKLSAAQPRLIGLDIYREVLAKRPSLNQRLAATSDLIAVCKPQDLDRIPPIEGIQKPPQIPDSRVGSSDLTLDADDVVRIQLLSAHTPPGFDCPTDYSFSSLLATDYLQQEGYTLNFPGQNTWQWGEFQTQVMGTSLWGQFRPQTSYGPYVKLNTQAHKIWLNYRTNNDSGKLKHPMLAFHRVTMQDVLENRLKPEELADRIVLIGVTARLINDYQATPFRNADGKTLSIPGVYLHAQMVSQLLSAVLDRRPLLRATPWLADGLMLFLGSTLLVLGLQNRRLHWIGLAAATGTVLLYGIAWAGFIWVGWVLPLVPGALVLVGSGLGAGLLSRRRSLP